MSTTAYARDEYVSEKVVETAMKAEEVNPRVFKRKMNFNVLVVVSGILMSGISVFLVVNGGVETQAARRLVVVLALSGGALFLIGLFSVVALISGNIIQQHLNLVAQKFETHKATQETYAVIEAFVDACGHLEKRTQITVFSEVKKAPQLQEHEGLKEHLSVRMKV